MAYSMGGAQHPNVVGMGLFALLDIAGNWDPQTGEVRGSVEFRRKGKLVKFTMDLGALTIGLAIGNPVAAKTEAIRVVASTGFDGMVVLEPSVATRLGLARFEVPGRARIDGGSQKGECVRTHIRLKIPEIDVDEVVPAAVWPE
ncbi:hypothetical protein ACFL59_09800 [Planctomycetota bacterium]